MHNLIARQQMVDQQVRTWEVLDPKVLGVLGRLPRELFTPPGLQDLAFADTGLPIGQGQTMLAPMIHGRILQTLAIAESDRTLEVGTGTGYLTAALCLLSNDVTSIEYFAELSAIAAANLRQMPGCNASLQVADVFAGPNLGQYDAIAVTGSLPVYDTRFERALNIGGRLFVVIGSAPVMRASLVRRVDETQWVREILFETVIDPLIHAPASPRFVF
jgi:protein-L-isoaspartate(D-aspartate) O-methyltransferase